jgi:hypothetical protein
MTGRGSPIPGNQIAPRSVLSVGILNRDLAAAECEEIAGVHMMRVPSLRNRSSDPHQS